jgi:hypothetical protein
MNSFKNEILSLGLAEQPENLLWYQDDIPFVKRSSPTQKFSRHLAKVQRKPLSFSEEAILAAKKIGAAQGRKITILASGGSDSEAVIHSFLRAQVPFQIVAIDFSSVNVDELAYLKHFCKLNGLSFQTIHIDIKKFWEEELESIALSSGSVSPQICAILSVIDRLDEYVVVGDGDIDIFEQNDRFYDTWGEKWAYAAWMLQTKHPGCPAFFSYTSELEASMYLDPMVEDFVNEGWAAIGHSRFHVVKPFFYYHHFGLRFRPKIDIFQPIRDLDLQWRKFLAQKMPGADSYYSIELDLIKKMKLGTLGDSKTELINYHDLLTEKKEKFLVPLEQGQHLILRNSNILMA